MTYISTAHPGTTSRGLLMLQAQARPVALALLGVMIVGLAAALQGFAILWPFLGAATVAYLIAAAFGQHSLHQTPAEIEVRGPFAVIRSVWDAAPPKADTPLVPVLSTRLEYGEFHVGVGDTIRTLSRSDWPEFDALVAAFREASLAAEALGTTRPPPA
ncbi:MAG: hypothetical protein AAF170_09865 [Bacteroidota bacterium]